jgi:pectinesterase
LRSGAYYTQVRNPPTNHGYVYSHCTFDGAPGVTGNFFSRIAPTRFPASEVVLLDCTLSRAVGPVAWQFQGAGDTSRIHFWEFNSRDAAGKPIDASKRLAGSRQLQEPADGATIANYRNPAFVLGGDWNPHAVKAP